MIYDPAAKTSKELVSTEAIGCGGGAARRQEARSGGRIAASRVGGLQWSASGKELLYDTGGDLFLIHVDNRQMGATDQDRRRRATTRSFRPTERWSRSGGLRICMRSTSRAGQGNAADHGGSDTLRNGGLDWVYPEELDLGTAYWWSPDSKSIAYLQFDTSREPVYPHEDLLASARDFRAAALSAGGRE